MPSQLRTQPPGRAVDFGGLNRYVLAGIAIDPMITIVYFAVVIMGARD